MYKMNFEKGLKIKLNVCEEGSYIYRKHSC